MVTILVVDDEATILERIHAVFSDAFAGRARVLKAYSAVQACALMRRVAVDLLFTDIVMPGMSGLELTEWAERMNPRCRVIIFTGYDVSEYARSAVRFSSCVDFMLKTQDDQTLIAAVDQQICSLERSAAQTRLAAEDRLAAPLARRDETLIRFLLLNGAPPEAGLLQIDADLPVLPICARAPESAAGGGRAVIAAVETYLSAFPRCEDISLSPGEWLLIAQGEANLADFEPVTEYVRSKLCAAQDLLRGTGAHVSFAFSESPCSFSELPERARELRSLLAEHAADEELMLEWPRHTSPKGTEAGVTKAIREYIDKNIGDPALSVEVLAEMTYYNPSHLSRLFKQREGVSVTAYIAERRCARAKELLLAGEMQIQQIARAVGIISPSYFSMFFRKQSGVTPAEFQRQSRLEAGDA